MHRILEGNGKNGIIVLSENYHKYQNKCTQPNNKAAGRESLIAELMDMDEKELKAAIDQTKTLIYQLKQQIEETRDQQEKSQLQRRLKELQYLQLWQLAQLG